MDLAAVRLSLSLAMWTVLVLIPLATLLARLIAWRRFTGKPLLEAAIALPLVLPPTVLGFYLLEGFSQSSLLGRTYHWLFGSSLAFSFSGLVVASLIFNLPFAVQPIQRSFETIARDIREAAWVSGLSSWQTFWRIELPLAWPGFVSAMALVFAHTLGEFGVVLMVGGNIPGETRTAAIAIYDQVQGFDIEGATRLSMLLLAISLMAMFIVNWSGQRRRGHRLDRL